VLRIIKKPFRLGNSNSLYLSQVLDIEGYFHGKEVLHEAGGLSRVPGVGGGILIDPLLKAYINGGKEPGSYVSKA
jgi:hypothetical protein